MTVRVINDYGTIDNLKPATFLGCYLICDECNNTESSSFPTLDELTDGSITRGAWRVISNSNPARHRCPVCIYNRGTIREGKRREERDKLYRERVKKVMLNRSIYDRYVT